MRKLFIYLSFTTALALGFLLLSTAQPTQMSGDGPPYGSAVINQESCRIELTESTYEGSGTEVLTNSGHWNFTCNADLVDGTDVDNTTRTEVFCDQGTKGYGDGDLTLNPGGRAHLECHF